MNHRINHIYGILTLIACLSMPQGFAQAESSHEKPAAGNAYRLLAGAGLGRKSPTTRNERNRDFQDEVQVLGLYVNLQGGNKAYSVPVPPSDEEPANLPVPVAPPGTEPDAKMNIFYHAQMTLLIRPGAKYFNRNPVYANLPKTGLPKVGERTAGASELYLIPGGNLLLGMTPKYCDDCDVMLGYAQTGLDKGPVIGRTILMGGRSAALGLHLRFAHPEYGELRVLPYFLPAFSHRNPRGKGLPREIFYGASTATPGSKNEGPGSRLEYRLRLSGLELSFFHSRRKARGERGEFRGDYTGFGLGGEPLAGLLAYISLERMTGTIRAFASMTTVAKAPPPQPAGGALRIGGRYLRGGFRVDWNLFLPRAAERKAGERETTGYILAGGNPLDSFLLGGTLEVRPAPRIERVLSPSPGKSTDSLPGLEHAGTLAVNTAYAYGFYEASLGLNFLQPLQDQAGRGPFALKKKDGEAYLEVSLALSMRLSRSRARLAYSRLYFRSHGGRRIAGESVYFILEYAP